MRSNIHFRDLLEAIVICTYNQIMGWRTFNQYEYINRAVRDEQVAETHSGSNPQPDFI